MALKSDAHAEAKAERLAAVHPHADGEALAAAGIDREELARLERALRGSITVPGMPDYDADRKADPRYPAKPLAIVYVETPGDVRLCLREAARHGWPFACRSGGHSSAGYSTIDGLVIDVSRMDHVVVDAHRREVRVGAGCTLGRLNAVLSDYGLHIPGGTCADVGVAGHMQGGGYGFTSREFGMNCDCVVGATVLLADGRVVATTPEHEPDLLWALRGGTGGNFGVLLDVTYRLVELGPVWGFALTWPAPDAAEVLTALQAGYMRGDTDPRVGYLAILSKLHPADPPSLVVMGTYDGTQAAGREALAPLTAIGAPDWRVDQVGEYDGLNEVLLDVLPGPGDADTLEAKRSGYVAQPLGRGGWQSVVDFFATTPDPYNIAVLEPYGGAIAAVPVQETAFIHRAVDCNFFVDSFWQASAGPGAEREALAWLDGYFDVMAPHLDGHTYQNYPERGTPGYRHQYWGDAFGRLLEIKQRYDPENRFVFEQSISPDPEGAA